MIGDEIGKARPIDLFPTDTLTTADRGPDGRPNMLASYARGVAKEALNVYVQNRDKGQDGMTSAMGAYLREKIQLAKEVYNLAQVQEFKETIANYIQAKHPEIHITLAPSPESAPDAALEAKYRVIEQHAQKIAGWQKVAQTEAVKKKIDEVTWQLNSEIAAYLKLAGSAQLDVEAEKQKLRDMIGKVGVVLASSEQAPVAPEAKNVPSEWEQAIADLFEQGYGEAFSQVRLVDNNGEKTVEEVPEVQALISKLQVMSADERVKSPQFKALMETLQSSIKQSQIAYETEKSELNDLAQLQGKQTLQADEENRLKALAAKYAFGRRFRDGEPENRNRVQQQFLNKIRQGQLANNTPTFVDDFNTRMTDYIVIQLAKKAS